jgi:serine/threonine protein kinase
MNSEHPGNAASDSWRRAREVFEQVRELPLPDRHEALERLCAGDAALRDEVASLLSGDGGPTLDTPGPGASAGENDAEPGMEIGNYRIGQLLGEGGFGAVYLAEQVAPIMRTVAIKIIKAGMDSREVIARFETERQALASMDHPGIARVLDAGRTAAGRPFFVMELVKGVPITDYCVQSQPRVAARLALFQQVCHAVQHAHQKGIIHRDLKPSNILVTLQDGRPVVKVIDFGIAKATGFSASAGPVLTRVATLLGTPAYMAPEQADLGVVDVDTRADIYSLGVVLYEMLTGTTPLSAEELQRVGFSEMRRLIREADTPKPSTRAQRLRAVGGRTGRAATVTLAATELRGDIDWVVMKAIDKDRSRRYDSAADLAADIGRHLTGQAVIAAPPSRMYLTSKFVRRHRVAVGAASIVAIALCTSAVIAFRSLMHAERALALERSARDTAAREREDAVIAREQARASEAQVRTELARSAAVMEFLRELLQTPLPQRAGADVRLAEVLRRSDSMIQGRFVDVPETELAVRDTVTGMLMALEAFADAEPHAARCLELAVMVRPMEPGAEKREADLEYLMRWHQPLWRIGVHTGRPGLAPSHVDRLTQRLGADDPRIIALRRVSQSSAVAARAFSEPAPPARASPPDDARRSPVVDHARAAHAELVATLGEFDPRTIDALFELAQRQASARQLQDADATYAAALEAERVARGADDPARLEHAIEYAIFRAESQDQVAACATLKDAIADARKNGGDATPAVVPALIALGQVQGRGGDLDAAIATLVEARSISAAAMGPLHTRTLLAQQSLILLLGQAGRLSEAEREADKLLADAQAGGGADGTLVGAAYGTRAAILRASGRHADAASAYQLAIAHQERTQPSLPMLTYTLRLDRADCLMALERWTDTERELLWFCEPDGRTFRAGIFDSMKQAVAGRLGKLYADKRSHATLPNAPESLEYWRSFAPRPGRQ